MNYVDGSSTGQQSCQRTVVDSVNLASNNL